MGKVTDPALLAQLDGGKVTDPALLQQLDGAQPKVGTAQAVLSGVAHGGMMGFGDKAVAGWKSLLKGTKYKAELADAENSTSQERSQHPIAYGVSEAAGSIAPSAAAAMATGGTSLSPTLLKLAPWLAAGQGAVQGAGYSNADSASGLARDSAVGAGVGLAGYGVGQAVGSAGRSLSRFFRGKAVQAGANATAKAADEISEKLASAKGSLGGEVQKGSRLVENIGRLGPDLPPAQQGAVQALQPEMQALKERVGQSTINALPSQAATIGAKDAELQALKQGASAALKTRAAELMQTSFGRDALSMMKSYGEPVAAAYLANKVAEGMGADPQQRAEAAAVAGLIFGRTRAGKALMTRLTRPGNAAALAGLGEGAADYGSRLLQLTARGAAPLATQKLVTP